MQEKLGRLRSFLSRVLLSKIYDRFAVIVILISLVQLALDSPIVDPKSSFKHTLYWVDFSCIVVFSADMVLKMVV